jgi:pilus assembly protein Flp/PilA
MRWLQRFVRDEEGAGLAEYALLLFLIALACLVVLGALGGQISTVFQSVVNAL